MKPMNLVERRTALGKIVGEALCKTPNLDLKRASPEIEKAEAEMETLWFEYLESDRPVTLEALIGSAFHNAYKRWRDLHKVTP